MLEPLKILLQNAYQVLTLSVALAVSFLAVAALVVVLRKAKSVELTVLGHKVVVIRKGTNLTPQGKEKTRRATASGVPATDDTMSSK